MKNFSGEYEVTGRAEGQPYSSRAGYFCYDDLRDRVEQGRTVDCGVNTGDNIKALEDYLENNPRMFPERIRRDWTGSDTLEAILNAEKLVQEAKRVINETRRRAILSKTISEDLHQTTLTEEELEIKHLVSCKFDEANGRRLRIQLEATLPPTCPRPSGPQAPSPPPKSPATRSKNPSTRTPPTPRRHPSPPKAVHPPPLSSIEVQRGPRISIRNDLSLTKIPPLDILPRSIPRTPNTGTFQLRHEASKRVKIDEPPSLIDAGVQTSLRDPSPISNFEEPDALSRSERPDLDQNKIDDSNEVHEVHAEAIKNQFRNGKIDESLEVRAPSSMDNTKAITRPRTSTFLDFLCGINPVNSKKEQKPSAADENSHSSINIINNFLNSSTISLTSPDTVGVDKLLHEIDKKLKTITRTTETLERLCPRRNGDETPGVAKGLIQEKRVENEVEVLLEPRFNFSSSSSGVSETLQPALLNNIKTITKASETLDELSCKRSESPWVVEGLVERTSEVEVEVLLKPTFSVSRSSSAGTIPPARPSTSLNNTKTIPKTTETLGQFCRKNNESKGFGVQELAEKPSEDEVQVFPKTRIGFSNFSSARSETLRPSRFSTPLNNIKTITKATENLEQFCLKRNESGGSGVAEGFIKGDFDIADVISETAHPARLSMPLNNKIKALSVQSRMDHARAVESSPAVSVSDNVGCNVIDGIVPMTRNELAREKSNGGFLDKRSVSSGRRSATNSGTDETASLFPTYSSDNSGHSGDQSSKRSARSGRGSICKELKIANVEGFRIEHEITEAIGELPGGKDFQRYSEDFVEVSGDVGDGACPGEVSSGREGTSKDISRISSEIVGGGDDEGRHALKNLGECEFRDGGKGFEGSGDGDHRKEPKKVLDEGSGMDLGSKTLNIFDECEGIPLASGHSSKTSRSEETRKESESECYRYQKEPSQISREDSGKDLGEQKFSRCLTSRQGILSVTSGPSSGCSSSDGTRQHSTADCYSEGELFIPSSCGYSLGEVVGSNQSGGIVNKICVNLEDGRGLLKIQASAESPGEFLDTDIDSNLSFTSQGRSA